ncbi:MAG: glyoxalase [Ruminococcaceae bacterium]|nr:glyoxalase [Oscillospiraceae bacterium]
MKIEHIGVFVFDLVGMRDFYASYFGFIPNDSFYENARGLKTCFMRAPDGGARLELMTKPNLTPNEGTAGMAHIALSVGSKETVDSLTEWLKNDGYQVTSGPRTTGDGYYESCVLDPEGNTVEITV